MIFWDGGHLHCSNLPKASGELVAMAVYTIIFACTAVQFMAAFSFPIHVTLTPPSNATNTAFAYPDWFNHTLGNSTLHSLNGTNSTNLTASTSPGKEKPGVIKLTIIRTRMKMTVDDSTSAWNDAAWPFVNATFLDGLHVSKSTQTKFLEKLEKDQKVSYAQLRASALGFPITLAIATFVLFMTYTMLHHWLKVGGITANTMDIPWFGRCHKVYIGIFLVGFAVLSTLIGLGVTFGIALSRSLTALHSTFALLEPQVSTVSIDRWSSFIQAFAFTMPAAFMAVAIAAYLTWRYDAISHNPYGISADYPKTQAAVMGSMVQRQPPQMTSTITQPRPMVTNERVTNFSRASLSESRLSSDVTRSNSSASNASTLVGNGPPPLPKKPAQDDPQFAPQAL